MKNLHKPLWNIKQVVNLDNSKLSKLLRRLPPEALVELIIEFVPEASLIEILTSSISNKQEFLLRERAEFLFKTAIYQAANERHKFKIKLLLEKLRQRQKNGLD